MNIYIKIIRRVFQQLNITDEEITNYVKYKINKYGGKVGKNFDMIASSIDLGEPYLVSIGDNVTISGVKILTHDASLKKSIGYTKVGRVSIGNNVFIGWGSVVLMNSRIGNNVVIGAGSIVSGEIPDNSVAVGNPCKVICSYDDYMKRMIAKMEGKPVIDKTPAEIMSCPDDISQLINAGYGFVK